MILAKDLIALLRKVPETTEIVLYAGQREGLHLSHTEDEPFGWIEIGDNDTRIMIDNPNHHIEYDVMLCPRCHDQDMLPGHNVCNNCKREMWLDKHV